MASHQEIAGVSDQDFVQRMINSHDGRFDEVFWNHIEASVKPLLPTAPRIVDLGCGPGLLARDFALRFPAGDIYGFDLTAAMIDHANNKIEFEGKKPSFEVLDITANPVPLEDGSVHLLTMAAVLHVLDDPLKICHEIRRLLAPGGVFLLVDWVRQPLSTYLDMMMANVPPETAEQVEKSMLRLSVAHNKYTVDDWIWLLDKGGLKVLNHTQLRSAHFCELVCQAK